MAQNNREVGMMSVEEKRALLKKIRCQTDGDWPLSLGQRALWLLQKQCPDMSAYNVASCLEIQGKIDSDKFRAALAFVQARHPTLRSRMTPGDVIPRQRFTKDADMGWYEAELAGSEEQIKAEVYRAYRQPFDLEKGPLTRAHLFRLEKERWIFLLSIHHIAVDGMSLWKLLDEISQVYTAMSSGLHPTLPEIASSYLDYIVDQRRFLASEGGQQQLSWWREKLSGELPILQLLPDELRPPIYSFNGAEYKLQFTAAFNHKYIDYCRERGVTPFVLGLALYAVLLHRYTRQNDILIATPSAGESQLKYPDAVGYFVNPLPIRVRIDESMSFDECLSNIQDTIQGALENQDIPFPVLVEKLSVPRDPSHPILCQSMFVYQKQPQVLNRVGFADRFYSWRSLQAKQFPLPQQTGQFDITLEILEDAGEISSHWKYNSDIFYESKIRGIADAFVHLAEGVFEDSRKMIGRYLLLAPQKVNALMPPPEQTIEPKETIISTFTRVAKRFPDSIAISDDQGTMSYSQLEARSNLVAHQLLACGIDRECPVGLALPRSRDLIVAILATLKTGCYYLPLDPNYPTERLQHMIEDSGCQLVVTHSECHESVKMLGTSSEIQPKLLIIDSLVTDAQTQVSGRPPEVEPSSLAYILYTSGSTGKPKGVRVTHHNVMRLFTACDQVYDFDENDTWTMFHSYAFDFTVWEIWGALLYGGKLVMVPYSISRSPEEFYTLLQAERVTVLSQTPSAFQQLIKVDTARAEEDRLDHVRWVVFGGEALNLTSLRPWFNKYGDDSPKLVNMYGITETTVHVTQRRLTQADMLSPHSLIGKPLADLHVMILDAEQQPVPIGVPGEIFVGGGGVSQGYHRREELSALRFLDDPLLPGQKMYRTGDLGVWCEEGSIAYLGRIDHQVQLRGFRIELGEIEAKICAYPSIDNCIVLLREDNKDDQRLVAYVTLENPLDVREFSWLHLKEFLSETLPAYMLPSTAVLLESIPLTVNGKVDRAALPKPDYLQQMSFVNARDSLEQQVACLWAEVLDIFEVGIHDNFFDIGGHSLLAASLVNKMSMLTEPFGLSQPPSLTMLMQYPTVASLCHALRRQTEVAPWSPLVTLYSRGDNTPLFVIPGGTGNALYYQPLVKALAQIEQNQRPVYGLQAWGLDGIQPLPETVEDIARKNIDVLRSIQPEGPYLIAGHCFGGLVAYEMALQLTRAGHLVQRLVLFDVPAPLPNHKPPAIHWQDCEWLRYFIQIMVESTKVQSSFSSSDLLSLSSENQVRACQQYLEQAGVIPETDDVTAATGMFNVFKHYSQLTYQPNRSHRLPISLFRAREAHAQFDYGAAEDATSIEASSLGWRQAGEDSLNIILAEGNHITMLQHPQVETLARLLAKELQPVRPGAFTSLDENTLTSYPSVSVDATSSKLPSPLN